MNHFLVVGASRPRLSCDRTAEGGRPTFVSPSMSLKILFIGDVVARRAVRSFARSCLGSFRAGGWDWSFVTRRMPRAGPASP